MSDQLAKYANCLSCGSDEWEKNENEVIVCRECGAEK